MSTYEVLEIQPRARTRLQQLADQLADVERRLAEVSGEKESLRDKIWDLLDGLAGPSSYVIFESGAPWKGKRMVRQVSQVRSFDLDVLRTVVKPGAFKQITRLAIDTEAFDVLVKRQDIDAEAVEAAISYTPRISGPLWKPSAGDVHLEPGQLALVKS